MNPWIDMNTVKDIVTGLSFAGVIILFAIQWRDRRKAKVVDKLVMHTLQNDMRALTTAAVGMGERLRKLEQHQRSLAEKQQTLDLHESANQPYEQAIRMARQGSKPTELVKNCGLSDSEAELISIMHRLDKTA